MTTQWLTIQTPAGARCWPLAEDPARHQDQIDRARAVTSFPHGDDWIRDPASAWRLMLSVDRPHTNVDARERDPAELDRVPDADVQAWRDAEVAATRQRRIDRAVATLRALDPAERADAIAQHGRQPMKERP